MDINAIIFHSLAFCLPSGQQNSIEQDTKGKVLG